MLVAVLQGQPMEIGVKEVHASCKQYAKFAGQESLCWYPVGLGQSLRLFYYDNVVECTHIDSLDKDPSCEFEQDCRSVVCIRTMQYIRHKHIPMLPWALVLSRRAPASVFSLRVVT